MSADASFESGPRGEGGPIGPGLVVLVVGPSGAGKDSIIRAAESRLRGDRRFVFPRRIVTRAATAAEDHHSVTPAEFEDLLRRGSFALHWRAHGLHYGISNDIDLAVRAGASVVFNASRHAVPTAQGRYRNVGCVLIETTLQLRAERLAARDRERPDEISARLRRVVGGVSAADADLAICNDGTLDRAVDILTRWLRAGPVSLDRGSSQ